MFSTPNWMAPAASRRFRAVAVVFSGSLPLIFDPHDEGTPSR